MTRRGGDEFNVVVDDISVLHIDFLPSLVTRNLRKKDNVLDISH